MSDIRGGFYLNMAGKRQDGVPFVPRVFQITPAKVWVIGASQVRRAEPVALQTYGDNFGLKAHVSWFGKGGMGWSGVLPRFYQELSTQGPPDILVLHAGGNDLGLVDANELVSQMEMDLRRLRKEVPKMKIVFSLLHERQRWRNGAAPEMEQCRKLVNSKLRRVLTNLQCEAVEHRNIRFFHKKAFVPDGVHFTKHGNEIFLDNIREVIKKVFTDNSGSKQNQNSIRPRVVFKKIPPKVWVIGASQVSRAEPVAQQTYGDHFGLDARVHWFGKDGMGWFGVLPRFYDELLELEDPPDVLVLHAGGNNLGLVDTNELVSQVERDLRRLRKEFPKMKIVFSLLHERQRWRYGAAPKMEQCRRLVNSKLRRVLTNLQCEAVEHNIRFFHKQSFVPDGVHFTKHGNEIFLDNIQQIVKKILKDNCGSEQSPRNAQ